MAADPVGDVLARVEKSVGGIRGLKTDFVQVKKLAAFRNPIRLTGRICLRHPGAVAWHVHSPLRYSVVVTEKTVRQWDEETDAVQTIEIARYPAMRIVIDQMSMWFGGRYSSLRDEYEIDLTSADPVVLKFVPREGSVASMMIRRVEVGLRPDERYLAWISITEAGGDGTRMEFSNTVIDPEFGRDDFKVKGSD